MKKEKYLPVITRNISAKVHVSDVISIEKDSRRLLIDAEDSHYAYYEKMDNIQDLLDERFLRVQDGIVINMDKVKVMKDKVIYLTNGKQIMVNVNDYSKARRKFNEYIMLRK